MAAISSSYGRMCLRSMTSGRVYSPPDWKKWTWASIRPGMSHFPRSSITLAPSGMSTWPSGPRSLIRPSLMMTTVSGWLVAVIASTSVAPTSALISSAARLPVTLTMSRRKPLIRNRQGRYDGALHPALMSCRDCRRPQVCVFIGCHDAPSRRHLTGAPVCL